MEDEIVSVFPIHYSDILSPNVHVHQFPLLSRPLQIPPSAAASGKRIHARIRAVARKLEIHVPADTRPEIWNQDKSKQFGVARLEDDREKNQDGSSTKQRDGEEPRLNDVRLQSEQIPQQGVYMLGVIHDDRLHLVPVSETHQFRPTLTYLDLTSRKSGRSKGGAGTDSDSDDYPPDPDEPVPVVVAPKKEKKSVEGKEVQMSARKLVEDRNNNIQGGMSAIRREMLLAMRAVEEEPWQAIEYCDGGMEESNQVFQSILSDSEERLECKTSIATLLKSIRGL
ncbi:DNA-directed RNA polymerase III subunit Rpc5 [Pisolithus sp. B1]|nr:DNA-directed RNA polymerase III subunit Rpc5 [Pisolithus sp. B1]